MPDMLDFIEARRAAAAWRELARIRAAFVSGGVLGTYGLLVELFFWTNKKRQGAAHDRLDEVGVCLGTCTGDEGLSARGENVFCGVKYFVR